MSSANVYEFVKFSCYYHSNVLLVIAVVQIEAGFISKGIKAAAKSAAAGLAIDAVISGGEKVIDAIKG